MAAHPAYGPRADRPRLTLPAAWPLPSLRLDEKIRKLDEQLLKHKDTIQKTRGPAQEAAKRRALVVRPPGAAVAAARRSV